MKLTVIIVNYNVKYFVEQCLDSVIRASENWETEIRVMDNDSSDGSIDYLKARFPKVIVKHSGGNVGFSKANNQAIRESQGEYILLLNPDTFVAEHTLDECIRWMDLHPGTGAVGVKMLGADGAFALESRRGFPSPMTAFYKICGLCDLFPYSRRFGKYYMRYLDKDQPAAIDILSGAFMMLRKSALDKAGLLDETFFMYGEDVDLSYRITQAGYTNEYLPAPILHYKGESTKKDSAKYVNTFYDAMLIFFRKHFPHYSLGMALAVKSAILLRAAVAHLARLLKKVVPAKPRPFRFLVLGSERTVRDVQHICRKNKLSEAHHYLIANERTSPNGHLAFDTAEFTHVVYDTTTYSYACILRLMEQSARQGKPISVGTYSPQRHVLITPETNFV